MRFTLCTIWFTLLTLGAAAQDWPAFRGPNSSGLAPANFQPPEKFDATTLRWTAKIPFGRSSPIVIGKQVILSASEGDRLMVLAFDATSGKERWRYQRTRKRSNEIDAKRNDPASSTPAGDSTGIFAFFADFGLVALDPRNGKLQWELELGPFTNNYGMSTSPVVAGESVYLQIDQGHDSYLLALNRRTGAVRWKSDRMETIEGWSTPILTPSGQILALSSNGLEAFSAETGAKQWLVPAPNSIMIPVPALHGANRVIATMRGSEKTKYPDWDAMLADLDQNGDGKLAPHEIVKRFEIENFGIADPDRDGYITGPEWKAYMRRGVGDFGFTSIDLTDHRIVWRNQRGLPYVPSPLVYENVLYSVRTGGFLLAIDAETGAMRKEGRLTDAGGEYFASLVEGGGRLFAISAEGKATVIRAGAEWEIQSSFDLGEPVAATPAIGAGSMYIRTQGSLRCYRAPR